MKKYFAFALVICTLNLHCTKEQICSFLAAADLISEIKLPVSSIVVGEAASAINEVTNIAAEALDCANTTTMEAEESTSLFNILYRNSPSEPWEVLPEYAQLLLDIERLIANESDLTAIEYLFNVPGQYKWSSLADNYSDVIERDEVNNGFEIEGRSEKVFTSNNQAESEILTVHSVPGFTFRPGQNFVQIISIKKVL